MIDCGQMTDKMVLVLHGRAEWNAAEAGHMAACADCGAEWRLLERTARLDDGTFSDGDADRIAARALARLARHRTAARWRHLAWAGGLAAAASIAILLWPGSSSRMAPDVAVAPLTVRLAELQGLDAAVLETVLEDLDAPAADDTSLEAPAMGDLEATELERVLRSLEG